MVLIPVSLLFWFGLDIIGIDFGNTYLVTRSWREDGIFFLISLISFLLFMFKEKIGKYVLAFWLTVWLIIQFIFHELQTITGTGQGLIRYFSGSLKWIQSDTRYFPDVYHTILHLLILSALVTTLLYLKKAHGDSAS